LTVPFPRAIALALRDIDPSTLPGRPATDEPCEGAKFHSPTPLILHDVHLSNGRVVSLCGCCRDNADVLAALLAQFAQDLEWPVRREFGNKLRALLIPREEDE
jgi:hypothetical protein